jgi:hypothetical protein
MDDYDDFIFRRQMMIKVVIEVMTDYLKNNGFSKENPAILEDSERIFRYGDEIEDGKYMAVIYSLKDGFGYFTPKDFDDINSQAENFVAHMLSF